MYTYTHTHTHTQPITTKC